MVTGADHAVVSASLTSHVSEPLLSLFLSLYSVAHIVDKQHVAYAALYDEPLSILSPPSRCVGASPPPPTDLSYQPRTLHCHFRSLISYLHVSVQRESGSQRLKQR